MPVVNQQTQILNDLYAAINTNDSKAVFGLVAEDIERIEPEGFPSSGTFHGRDKFLDILKQGRSTWAEGACHPERFLIKGDKIVVLVHVHVRLKDATTWIDARIADGFILRQGKVAFMKTFVERQQALDWAGIDSL